MAELIFLFKTIIMGIVEGITEFLPVSSTGHLIITQDVIGLPDDDFMKMFNVVIQLGAILAVLILFWPRLSDRLGACLRKEKRGWRFLLNWFLATLPALVLGLAWEKLDLDQYLFSLPTVCAALVVGAILLLLFEKAYLQRRLPQQSAEPKYDLDEIRPKEAFIVGCMQCLALWPGFSRSASTIMGGWLAGFRTDLAADFSFFLAIPVMFGASTLKLVHFDYQQITLAQVAGLILGFVVSFLVALLVVRAFLSFLRRHRLAVFAYYRLALAALLIILIACGVVR